VNDTGSKPAGTGPPLAGAAVVVVVVVLRGGEEVVVEPDALGWWRVFGAALLPDGPPHAAATSANALNATSAPVR
jgi:hypothetical protein